jgi:signal peptidase I
MLKHSNAGKKPFWRELLESLSLAFVFYLIISNYAVQAYEIPSGSMRPTLLIGDQLIVSKLNYDITLLPGELRIGMANIKLPWPKVTLARVGTPQRGDIIVFKNPEGGPIPYIKRIMALPGETVEVRGQEVFINGKPLNDAWGRYLNQGRVPSFGPVVVPGNSYFVMGDNRDHSHDSRFWHNGKGGFVPREDIIGQAVVLYWPGDDQGGKVSWNRWGVLLD